MPVPTVGSAGGSERGVQSASQAPSGAASQTSVTAGSGYPTIAESLGQRRVPPLKAAPSSKGTTAISSKSEDTGPAAAKGSTSAPSVVKEEKTSQASATASASKEQDTAQPARAPRAPDVRPPVEKDAAMTYTELVMKQAASAVPTSKLTDEEYEKLAWERWQKMLAESATSVSGRATSVAYLPKELRGEMLPPQPLFSPIRGWIDGLTPPVHKEGRTIELFFARSGRYLQVDPLGRVETAEETGAQKGCEVKLGPTRYGWTYYDHRSIHRRPHPLEHWREARIGKGSVRMVL